MLYRLQYETRAGITCETWEAGPAEAMTSLARYNDIRYSDEPPLWVLLATRDNETQPWETVLQWPRGVPGLLPDED